MRCDLLESFEELAMSVMSLRDTILCTFLLIPSIASFSLQIQTCHVRLNARAVAVWWGGAAGWTIAPS